MEKHGVVPDVIPVVPKETAVIKYGNVSVELGNELTPTQVKDPPTSLTWTVEPNALYTLIFADPDIPKQFNFKQFQHWLVVNIPGNDISKGDTLFEYVGSGPPQGSGLHRYIFLIYEQPAKLEKPSLNDITDNSMADRGKFMVENLVQKLNLGNPIAGNFYKAQYDDYVATVHQKLGEKYDAKK